MKVKKMTKPVTINDSIFKGQWSAGTPTVQFLTDVVDLINRSPTLVAEINAVDSLHLSDGSTASVNMATPADDTSDTTYHGSSLMLPPLAGYDDSQALGVSASLGKVSDPVSPAGMFVGELAFALGRWQDSGLRMAATGQISSLTSEQFVALDFASNGKAFYNQYVAKSQIEATEVKVGLPSGLSSGKIYFQNSSNLTQDDAELRQLQKLSSGSGAYAASIDYTTSQFWDAGYGPTHLVHVWNSFIQDQSENYGFPSTDLHIDPTSIHNLTVQIDQSGVLTGSTLQTLVNGTVTNYVFSYTSPGVEDDKVYDAHDKLLYKRYIDLSKYASTGGEFSVGQTQNNGSIYQNDGEWLYLTGNSNSLTVFSESGTIVLGNSNSVGVVEGSVTVSGNGNTLFSAWNFDGEAYNASISGNQNNLTMQCGGSATVTGAGNVVNLGSMPGTGDNVYPANFVVNSTAGHTIFNVVAGNVTLRGGMAGDTYNLGTGSDIVFLGKGTSILTTGSGTATITGGGSDTIHGGHGGSSLFVAGNHSAETIYGFKPGSDYLSANGQKVMHTVVNHGNTLITLSSGATIDLIGNTNTGHLFG